MRVVRRETDNDVRIQIKEREIIGEERAGQVKKNWPKGVSFIFQ